MNSTRNDMKAALRGQMVDLLNVSLAELIDLGLQTKQAHWNVKGPNFIGLHKLFDELTDSVHDLADTVAERATALGGTALGLPSDPEVVGEPQQLERLGDALVGLDRKAHPTGFGEHVIRARPPARHEPVAHRSGERHVHQPTRVDVTDLAAPETELDPAEAVRRRRDPRPPRDQLHQPLHPIALRHTSASRAAGSCCLSPSPGCAPR